MSMFRFPLMKQVVSGLFSKKEKKTNRKERHLVMDALESRELLTVTAASTTSFYVNELPIYETSSDIIEQIQNLRDNNLSVDYDLGGDEDGDLVVVWERPDVIYTTKEGETSQFQPVIDSTTLSPSLDWNIYARYLTNETQRLFLDYDAYNTGTYSNISLFYGQMQDLDPDSMVEDPTVDTKIASGLVYKISFTSEAQPLSRTQDSINARFSIYAYDSTGQSTVSTFTFNEEYTKTLSIDAETDEDVLNYTNSMETNAAELQAKLRGLGQTQGKYLNDCVVKAISPTEFYVYVYSEDIQATWDGSKWVYDGVPNLAIYQENPEGNDAAGFEVSAEISIVSSPNLYNNIKVDPTKPLDSADNIQKAFDAKKNTNLMAPIFMPAPDRINAQRRDLLEGPATESDMLISGGVYPEVLVVPVYGLTDDAGNSLDGYVYDITFVGSSSYINHPLLTALANDGTSSLSEDAILKVVTVKESSSEFRVNALEEADPADSDDPFKEVEYYNQLNPAVAMDADGDFVITWQSEVSNTLVRGSYTDIYAKTYSARSYINDHSYLNDAYVEDESEKLWPSDMMVNTVDTYTYIEVDPEELAQNYYQKDSKTVYIQSVVETSKEFRVNTSTTNAQRNPDVAMDLDGNFVIVWDSEGQTISYFNGVYMQRYSKDGKAISAETRVDTEVTGASTNPSVAADDNGQFVVTWEYTNNPLMDIQFPYYTFFNHYFSYYYESDFYYMSEIHASVYNTIYPSDEEFGLLQGEYIVGGTDNSGGKDPQAGWSDTGDFIISWTGLETDTDSTGEISSGVYAEQYKVKITEVEIDQEDNAVDDNVDDGTDDGENTSEEPATEIQKTVNKVRNVYRVNSATFNVGNPTYWDYSQLVGQVGLDADGDVIVTYAGYGPDVSVNSIIPYISGSSLSTTNSYTLFLNNVKNLLSTQTSILKAKYGDEPFADLTNFFNPTGRNKNPNAGDYFATITKDKVDEDGTLVTFTSQRMQDLLRDLKRDPSVSDEIKTEIHDLTGRYECHGDVNSVIAMVLTNAQLLFKYDPQYETLRENEVEFQNVQNVVLGALASVLESQFGLLRGESSGVMFTQIDAAVNTLTANDNTDDGTDDGTTDDTGTTNAGINVISTDLANSAIIHSDSIANNKRDGVTAVANIALDVEFNRIWDYISLTVINKANQQTQVVGVDMFNEAYEDVGDGLYALNSAKAAEAIEQAISQAVNIVGTSWRDETNRELDLYEGPVEVRAIDWNELQSRGLMHIDDETTRYSNASMDMEMFRNWYTENALVLAFETGVARFEDFTFNDLLAYINNEDLNERERRERIDNLPVIFEIVFQGGVHDLELSIAWENATVRNAEVQTLTLNPNEEGRLYYAIQVNGEPDAFENPGQLLTFDCTDEDSVNSSIDSLRAYLNNLGYNPVEVELVGAPQDDEGEIIWGVGEYQIRVVFDGNVGENITMQYYGTFVLPPLTDEGGYNPADYPWLRNGRFRTIQDGGTVNRARYGVSMYYYGDLGTPQTDATINVTPEGSFQIGYLQHELYNSRTMSNQYASSTFNSYSNTNVLVRPFTEKTDTAGPKVSGISIDGKRVQQNAEINGDNINYVIVYFNEEMMYYDYRTKFSNSESADWDNSVINPENYQLTKDGTPLQGVITDIYYGMNISQFILDENGNPLSEFGSNKWEAVIMLDSSLVNGSYEIVANKRLEDVKGNRLNSNGENTDGSDTNFSFNVTTFEAEGPFTGEGTDKNYFEQTLEGDSDFRWSPNAVGINDDGDTVTVWISENDEGIENIYYQIEYAELVDGSYVVNPEKTVKLTLFDETGVDRSIYPGVEHNIQHASVAMGEDGDFILTWSEYNLDSSTGKVSWDVYARRYNLDGTPKDNLPTLLSYEEGINNHESLRVNTSTLGDQMYSSVAISAMGNYAITWMSLDYQDESEKINADWDIYAAQYYASGIRRVDEVATQEILFSSAIYEGSFQIQYTPDKSKYLETEDDVRTTSVITVIPPVGDEIYGKVQFDGATYDNTPANFAQVIKKALKEINIDATVEATSYDFFTVKFNAMDDSPIPANLGELAIVPNQLLVSSEGKAIHSTVRTKYAADSGEILVNESYMLTPGSAEVQRVSFGTGSSFSNLVSFYFEFDYTDYEGVVHNCKTTEPVVFRPGVNGAAADDNANDDDGNMSDGDQHLIDNDFDADSDESYHRIDSIINALGTFKDQFGNTVTIASDEDGDPSSLDRDVFLLGVDNNKNSVTIYFSNTALGYDVSEMRVTGVQVEDKKLAVDVTSKEISKGTMGGIIANPTAIAIANNPQNYYDLESRHQMFPDIGMDAEGNFVVTWTSYGDTRYGDSSTEANVYARRFDTEGNTICVGLVNTDNLEGTQKWSSVDMDRKGDFVITWTSDYEDNIEIYAKRYAFLKAYYNGEAPASQFDPNADSAGSYYTESYDTNKAGFLIDYKDNPIFFHSGVVNGNLVVENYADLEYKAMGGSFIVNTTQLGKQQYSKVAMDAEGNFIITWESDDATFNVAEKEYTVYAQKYFNNTDTTNGDIGKDGNEMTFSHTAVDGHSDRFPSVAMNSDGDWIVAWTCFPERDDTQSEIWHVVNREKPYDDDTSPVITKFQAVSPVEQGDLFTYVYDNDGNRVTDENGNPVFTWTDNEQRYSVNENNEINTVDINGTVTSNQPLNNPESPTYVYDDTTQKLDIYKPDGTTITKDVTVTDELPYNDFTSNGLLNYIFTNDDQTGQKEYAYTDTKDSYLDIGNGKIYNSDYKTQDMDYLVSEDYALDENGEQVVALIVGFSEEMSHTGASSVLNPSNWNIYRTDLEGNKVLVPIQGIVDREDSMFSVGDDGKNEIVIYIQPGEDGLPALEPGYTYEFIGSTDMEDLNKNPLDGSYSKWDYGKTDGQVGGTESTDFIMEVDVGIPSSLDSGNVSEDPYDFEAADLKGDTLVNYNNQEGIQENSAVAMDQYGNYIVVWETDWIPEDEDGDYQNNPALNRFLYKDGQLVASNSETTNGFRRIMAQMYDYDGNKVGQEFVVMLEEYTHQCSPDVAMDKYGNVVITWVEVTDSLDNHVVDSGNGDQEMVTLDPYEDGSNIMAVRFKVTYDNDYYVTNLAQYGDFFQVDNDVRGVKTNPKVAIDSATGNFVITWANEDYSTREDVLISDNNYPNGTVDRYGIYASIYNFTTTDDEPSRIASMKDSTGVYSDKPFLVNVADTVGQCNPSVAMENGNLIVVWQNSTLKSTINGRTFQLDSGGKVVQVNDQVVISENGQYSKYTPSVDMDSKGNAVVTYSSALQDGSEKGIYARTYKVDSTGAQTLKGLSQPEFRVNNKTFDDQFEPVVGLGEDGRCVISWVSFGHEVSDYDASATSRYSYGVFAKWYDDVFNNAAAMQNQKDVQINSLIYGSQFQQDISVNEKGECVFTWTGPGDLSRNYPRKNGEDSGTDAGAGDGGEGGGGSGNLTNIHDNLINGSVLSGVSNHVSVLDYSDIYRRRFLWTANSPSSLSPDFTSGEGTGTVIQNEEIDDDVNKTVIFSVADGTWTMVQDDNDPQQINSKILDVDGNGSEVTLYGSAGADTVRFMTTQRDGKTVDAVEMTNSLGQKITLYNFSKVNVVGRGGNDSVTFDTDKGTESRNFTATGSSATLSTSSYEYSVVDFANIDFNGVTGDTVEIIGTNDNDTVTLNDNSVTAKGTGYTVTADGFSTVKLNADISSDENSVDTMKLEAKNITSFNADSDGGQFDTTEYHCDFSGFDTVTANAKTGSSSLAGNPDVSLDVTSPDASLNMYSNKIILSENGKDVVITNFGNVTANIAPEAADCTVRIYDSNGNDSYLFDAASKTATMTLANGYKLTAIGTAAAEAYSKFGGTDSATFNDSDAADTVQTVARVMRMTDGDITDPTAPNSYYVTANGFAVNNAYSTDNQDTVLFVDETVISGSTTSNDIKDDFTVTCLDNKVMAFMQSTVKTSYSNTAWGFNTIVATSHSYSAVDTARVSDGSGDLAATTFDVSPDAINMVLANGTTIDVYGFRNKVATSDESAINLYDGYADDTLVIQGTNASMSGDVIIFGGNSNTYTITAAAPTLTATSVNGGADKATIICSADKVETIDVAHAGESVTVNVADSAGTFHNTVKDFKTATVNKADDKDSATVVIANTAYEMPITAQSYSNKFAYTQDGSYSRGVTISGALKSMDFRSENAGKLSAVNVSLHDSAMEDLLEVTTSERKAVIEQVATQQTRSFTVSGDDMITVSGDSTQDTKTVDGVFTDWDDWSDTDTWLKGE